jgi:hypothetical protein
MADTTVQPNQPEKEPQLIEDIFSPEKALDIDRPRGPETAPEKAREQAPEARPEQAPRQPAEDETSRRGYAPVAAEPVPEQPTAKTPELVKIEAILSENLDDLYMQMTPEQQLVFRQKGEETANKIELLLRDVRVKVREVLSAIRDWLKLLPGINKFFLEQEVKIKTDRLLAVHEQKNKQK